MTSTILVLVVGDLGFAIQLHLENKPRFVIFKCHQLDFEDCAVYFLVLEVRLIVLIDKINDQT